MSNYRTKNFSQYTRMFAALSNPHRTAILMRLAKCGCGETASCSHDEMRTCVGDIAKHLDIAASTVSHHIKELHQAGLIKMERRGRTIKCCVDVKAVRALADFLGGSTVRTIARPKVSQTNGGQRGR